MSETSNMNLGCRFCSIRRGRFFYGTPDLPIRATLDYFAIASIGGFVEGWTLVVPNDHCLSLRDFYTVHSFTDFMRRTVDTVEELYGPSAIFEHGANHSGSLTSCGTDHGHLHVVPIRFSLRDAIGRSALARWEPVRASGIRERVGDSEYLFFSEVPRISDPVGYLSILTSPVSQFFRTVIAENLGLRHVADYKKHPFIAVTERARARLANTA